MHRDAMRSALRQETPIEQVCLELEKSNAKEFSKLTRTIYIELYFNHNQINIGLCTCLLIN